MYPFLLWPILLSSVYMVSKIDFFYIETVLDLPWNLVDVQMTEGSLKLSKKLFEIFVWFLRIFFLNFVVDLLVISGENNHERLLGIDGGDFD